EGVQHDAGERRRGHRPIEDHPHRRLAYLMPSFTGDWYVDGPIIAAACLVAWATLWRKGIKPAFTGLKRFLDGVQRIAESTPILIDIAMEFRPNSGTTLRDTIDQMQREGNARREVVAVLQHTVDALVAAFETRHLENATKLDDIAKAVHTTKVIE